MFFLLSFNVFWFGLPFYLKYSLIILILMSFFVQLCCSFIADMLKYKNVLLLQFVICYMFFLSDSLFFIFVFYEMSLFPTIFLIFLEGPQSEKLKALLFLFVYGIFFGLPFLLLGFCFTEFFFFCIFYQISFKLCLFFIFSFLVKFPIYFFHSWLPKAHLESPTAVSIILAAVLLKLGTCGLWKIVYFMKFYSFVFFLFFLFSGLFLVCFLAVFQSDFKSMVAYSSVVHMTFLCLGCFFFSCFLDVFGWLLMLVHGLISLCLFFFVGFYSHLKNSRSYFYLNSLFSMGQFLLFIVLSFFILNFSVPPSISFICELSYLSIILMSLPFLFFISLFYVFLVTYYNLFSLLSLMSGKHSEPEDCLKFSPLFLCVFFCFFFVFSYVFV